MPSMNRRQVLFGSAALGTAVGLGGPQQAWAQKASPAAASTSDWAL